MCSLCLSITSYNKQTMSPFILFVLSGNWHRFFSSSWVQLPSSTSGQFHYRRTAFSSQLKSNVGNILTKSVTLWVTPNIHGTPIDSKSHSPITLGNHSSINLVSIFRCSSPPHNLVYGRRVDPSTLAFILSSHRHSYMSSVYLSFHHFIITKQ